MTDSPPPKQELLLAFYRTSWEEMTWRRNSGYRTVILGLGYCGAVLTVLACARPLAWRPRAFLAAVIAVTTIFGAAYLVGNFANYMAAARRMIRIEDYLGAYAADFLGSFGPLMPAARRSWADGSLARDPISFGSVLAFAVGGLVTCGAVLMM